MTRNPWEPVWPNTVVMYGASPDPMYPRIPDHWLPDVLPDATTPFPPQPAPAISVVESAEAIVARLKQRIADLERELKMHEAWKLELATLQRMLKAYESPEKESTDT